MKPILDKNSPVPLYYQLRTELEGRIKRGDWKPSQQLPTEDELAESYGVSKATVRQALRDLAQAELVRREQGRGTFVAETKIQFGPRRLASFTEEMRDFGMRSSSKVLNQGVVQADGSLAGKLNVAEGSDLYRIERLRVAGDEPMGLQTVHVPCHVAPGLLETDFAAASLYETLEKRFGLMPHHALQTHFALGLDSRQADLLKVAEGFPALGGERLTFLRDGQPLELTNSFMRGDRYQIQLKLERPAIH
jgi:GntR family transcriptional regulator